MPNLKTYLKLGVAITGLVVSIQAHSQQSQVKWDQLYAVIENHGEVLAVYDEYYAMPGISESVPLSSMSAAKAQKSLRTMMSSYAVAKSEILGQVDSRVRSRCAARFEEIDGSLLGELRPALEDKRMLATAYQKSFYNSLLATAMALGSLIEACTV